MIRYVRADDAAPVCALYNHYIENTTITFEEEALAAGEMARRIAEVTVVYPWLVWEEEGAVLGYAYARAFHARSAYRHTTETAIYLRHDATGCGIGGKLYRELIGILDSQGYHVLLGAIALPNEPSVRLHEQNGFTKAGHYSEVGRKFGRWIDVGYWQRTLPHRSPERPV